MIIYGTKATHVASEILSDTCSNCGTQGSIQMTIFQKYAHVFWIPFFPVGKTGATQCTHCKHVLERKEFPASLYGHYETMKINSRTPRWTFTGLSVITVIIVWGIVSKIENDQKNAVLILTPEAGDIYHIKKLTNNTRYIKWTMLQATPFSFLPISSKPINSPDLLCS